MPAKNEDLHGNVPDESRVALLIVDMINDFEFPGGDLLFAAALPVAERIARLKQRARKVGIPTLYVNDNFGKWRSDFRQQVQHCLDDPVRGQPIVRLLQPDQDDYFVLKPKHSAFYATPLDLLLAYLKVSTLIITGIAGDICILFTASDAFMRDYHLFVPADCVASLNSAENSRCLEQMHRLLDSDIRPYQALNLEAIQHPSGEDDNDIRQSGR
jgi:nicotinamidase-related amidase